MSEPTPATELADAPETEPEAAQPKETDWEAEAKKWEKRSKDNYAKLRDTESRLAEAQPLIEASKTAEQRQAEELSRWQSEAERWRSASITSRIEALAALEFAYPADAVAKLDAAKYLDAGGVIDEDAIKADLAALLEERPNWRRAQESAATGPRVPAPNPAQGSSGSRAAASPADQFASIIQGHLRS